MRHHRYQRIDRQLRCMSLFIVTLALLVSDGSFGKRHRNGSSLSSSSSQLRFGMMVVSSSSTTRVVVGGAAPVLDHTRSSYDPNAPRRNPFQSSNPLLTRRPNIFQRRSNPQHHTEHEVSLQSLQPPPPPLPPRQLPLRFLRAGKGDPVVGLQRYEATLQWRKEQRIDTILREAFPKFGLIKEHYKHYFHLRGFHNEPCFYEQPAKTNLRALRDGGVTLDGLLRHYAMITEFLWQVIERDDLAKSIYIIDLDGIKMTDFFGETIDFVKKAAGFSAQHYPERAGCVFIVNVPSWFKLIWQVVRPIIDEATLQKIFILRGSDEIRHHLMQRIPLEHIPLEYGGTGLALGQAPEEAHMANLVEHNNRIASQGRKSVCEACRANVRPENWPCPFCRWTPARSY